MGRGRRPALSLPIASQSEMDTNRTHRWVLGDFANNFLVPGGYLWWQVETSRFPQSSLLQRNEYIIWLTLEGEKEPSWLDLGTSDTGK